MIYISFYVIMLQYWPAQPDDPLGMRVASVIGFSVLCYIFSNPNAVAHWINNGRI